MCAIKVSFSVPSWSIVWKKMREKDTSSTTGPMSVGRLLPLTLTSKISIQVLKQKSHAILVKYLFVASISYLHTVGCAEEADVSEASMQVSLRL